VSPLPTSYCDAFNGLNWQNAMRDEYNALIKNQTWTLVLRTTDANIVCCMWLFHHKYLADGLLSRYKARLVANGISVAWDSSGMFFSQMKYAIEIVERAHMVNCNPSRTPVDTESKLVVDRDPVSNLTLYQSLIDYGLKFFSSSTTNLVAYLDADWAGCPTTRQSTSEAEYHSVANVVAKTCWLHKLLHELYTTLSSATLVYCDNISAVYLSFNPVQHQRTNHIEIDIHFVRDLVAAVQIRVLHVLSRYQFANIFTKGLSSALFEEFRSSLSIRCSPAPTAGEC
ncbi:ribonuclease H-like domain-containing protein, partial [Tanacetum coccineum]